MTAKAHIPVLDGVRGVAILLVLCVHFFQLFLDKSNTLLFKFGLVGQTGVDLFFVLSGFLITGILLDSRGSRHFIRNFFARRTLRIMPLYYLVLVGLYLVSPALHLAAWVPFKQNFWYWVYLQDVAQAFRPSLITGPNHFWSLAVEEHFYLFWPFFVMRFDNRRLLKIICGAVVVSILSRIVWMQYEMYYFTLARLDCLSLGAALAIFARNSKTVGLSGIVPWAKRALIFAAVATAICFVLPHSYLPFVRVFRNTFIAVFYASGLVLVLENQHGFVGRILAGAPLRSLGKYSYAMYIFHPFLFAWLYSKGLMVYKPWSLLLGAAVTYAFALISWRVLEKPALSFKRYFEYEVGQGPAWTTRLIDSETVQA